MIRLLLALVLLCTVVLPLLPARVALADEPLTEYELFELRTQTSKTYYIGGGQVRTEFYTGSIHYQDEGIWKPIDTRIVSATNGWSVTKGHYQLTLRPDTTTIVSKGEHKLGFRLTAIAYLDISTKEYHILSTTNGVTPIVSDNTIRWESIFDGVNLEIVYGADRLKENIEITQAARDALPNPNIFGLDPQDTYLVFIYQTDWTDSLPPKNVDISNYETESPIWFEDIKGKIVSFLPADYAWAEDEPENTVPVRKRLIEKNDKNYLLLGSKVTLLNQLAEGTIILDPSQTFSTTTADGYMARDDYLSGYAFCHDAVTSISVSMTWDKFGVGQRMWYNAWYCDRAGLFFDTSSLSDTIDISAAKVEIMVWNDRSNPDFNITLVDGSDLNIPLVIHDYGDLLDETVSYGSVSTAGMSEDVYYTITLNAGGISQISPTGITKFGVRSDRDINFIHTGIDTNEHVFIYSRDAGVSKAPKLSITYTDLPAIDTLAASGVGTTTATLNGNITAVGGVNATTRGFDWGLTTGYGFSWTENGDFGNGTFNRGISDLAPGTLYHFRAKAQNPVGWGYGADLTFTTTAIAPTISNLPATNVATFSARLNGILDDDGGATTTVYIYWGDNDGATDPVFPGGTWDYRKNKGAIGEGTFNYDASSLTLNTIYYYRCYAVNAIGNDWANSTETFTTLGGIFAPTNFRAIPRLTEPAVDLEFTKGLGSSVTYIRYSEITYPTTIADGIEVLCMRLDGSTSSLSAYGSCAHEGLTPGATYYYSAWGFSSGNYSASYATALVSTYATGAGAEDVDTTLPTSWFFDVDHTRVSTWPLYSIFYTSMVDEYEIPANTTFFILAMFFITVIGLAVYMMGRRFEGGEGGGGTYSLFLAIVVVIILMAVSAGMRVVPGFYAILYCLVAFGSGAVIRRI